MYHTVPLRLEVEGLQSGTSRVGVRLRDLSRARSTPSAKFFDAMLSLIAFIRALGECEVSRPGNSKMLRNSARASWSMRGFKVYSAAIAVPGGKLR